MLNKSSIIGTSQGLRFLSFLLLVLVAMVHCADEHQLRGLGNTKKSEQVEVECPAKVEEGESKMVIGGRGDFQSMKPRDYASIEGAILSTTNQLFAESCDPGFRTFSGVSFEDIDDIVIEDEEIGGHRDLQWGLTFNFTQISFSYIFHIQFWCRNCAIVGNHPLFVNDAGRQLLQNSIQSSALELEHRNMQESDVCYCDADAAKNPRAPTIKKFRNALAKEIRNLDLPVKLDPSSAFENNGKKPPTGESNGKGRGKP